MEFHTKKPAEFQRVNFIEGILKGIFGEIYLIRGNLSNNKIF
jgi:hypothetical protein